MSQTALADERQSLPGRYVVAHLKPDYLPATETFIYDLLSHAVRHDPVVLAERLLNLDQFPRQRLIDVRILRGGAIQRGLTRMRRALAGIPTLQAYRYLEALEDLEPRLIHAHFGPTGYMGALLKRKRRIPLVTTFYGYDLSVADREPDWRFRYAMLFREGDLFLVEGPRMQEQLIALGCPPEKTRIQRIGIDLSRFKFRRRQANRGQPIGVLHTGRMVEKKGHEIALRAFAACREEFPEIRLRMIGDGPLRPRIEAAIGRLDLTDAVELLGILARDQYLRELDRADIALQSSVTAGDGDSEGGAPTTLLDAQACGLPIVATRHADVPSVVEEGGSALLAAEGDAQALGQALGAMLRAETRWGDFGEKGRNFVTQHHNIDRTVAATEQHYDRLING